MAILLLYFMIRNVMLSNLFIALTLFIYINCIDSAVVISDHSYKRVIPEYQNVNASLMTKANNQKSYISTTGILATTTDIAVYMSVSVGSELPLKQICYYAIPRDNASDPMLVSLQPENLDPFLCTHIIVAFAAIRNSCLVPVYEEDVEVYQKVVKLKEKSANLKVLLSVGGNNRDGGFADLVRNDRAIARFSFQAKMFLLEHGFDGLDLDWEFPAWPVYRDAREKIYFTNLVVQLNNCLKLASHPPLLLSLAVAAPKTVINRAYQIPELARNVDFVSLMGYDYHMFWVYLPFTGFNAPLRKRHNERAYFATLNIVWSAQYWLKMGMPREKLVIGIPTYGRTWKLLSPFWHGIGAPAVGPGIKQGIFTYPNALEFLKCCAHHYFDEEALVPYAVFSNLWVSYEDRNSIAAKAEWIKSEKFAGVMTWNLNCDDHEGSISGRKFDLHRTIHSILHSVK